MRRSKQMVTLSVILLALAGIPTVIYDGIVATVDNEVILMSDLREEIAPFFADLKSQGLSSQQIDKEMEQAFQKALDRYIERLLLYRKAMNEGLKVDEKDIDDRIMKIKKRYSSPEEFQRLLEESGESMSEFRERIKQQIIALSYALKKRKAFENEITISEPEIAKYYNEHIDEFKNPQKVKVRRIFLQAPKEAEERLKVKERIMEIHDRIKQGADFSTIAENESQGPEADQGGLIGWVSKGDLVPELEQVIENMNEGDISQPIETEWGFHILKVEEKQGNAQIPYEKARIIIEPKLKEQYVNERYQKWIDELKKGARIRIFM
ncbi:MAG TPA: peptidylprolyl isomerase [Candidatus Hydrogenedens sp.]|nr:peptidylprolyl isomerase [Candidatus Hydrogenedens sp.]HOL20213.1 peptidylprolyl isomerase [Candidatus Hydrogenedens sp.]HPP59211.1 peptidylprolyl isomerase [Candidatus Hydrogenedens sp.]